MSKKTGYFKRYAMTLLFPLGMYAVFALITLIIGNASFFTGYTTEGIIHDTVENTIIALQLQSRCPVADGISVPEPLSCWEPSSAVTWECSCIWEPSEYCCAAWEPA